MAQIDLSDASAFVALVTGKGMEIPKDIAMHPQVAMIDGQSKYETGALPPLPPAPQLKGIFYSDALPLDRTQALQNEARRRGIPYVARGTGNALQELLRPILATAPRRLDMNGKGEADSEKKQIAPRGALSELIRKHHQGNTSVAEEARRIFDIAKRQGITTTLGSVNQAIHQFRRVNRLSGKPESLMDPKERMRVGALKELDDAIAGLQLTREFLETVETELTELRSFKAGVEALTRPKG